MTKVQGKPIPLDKIRPGMCLMCGEVHEGTYPAECVVAVPIRRARPSAMTPDAVATRTRSSKTGELSDYWVLMRPVFEDEPDSYQEFLQPDGHWQGVEAAHARRFATETEALTFRDRALSDVVN